MSTSAPLVNPQDPRVERKQHISSVAKGVCARAELTPKEADLKEVTTDFIALFYGRDPRQGQLI